MNSSMSARNIAKLRLYSSSEPHISDLNVSMTTKSGKNAKISSMDRTLDSCKTRNDSEMASL